MSKLEDGSIVKISERVTKSFKLEDGNYSSKFNFLRMMKSRMEAQVEDEEEEPEEEDDHDQNYEMEMKCGKMPVIILIGAFEE